MKTAKFGGSSLANATQLKKSQKLSSQIILDALWWFLHLEKDMQQIKK